MAQSNWNGGIKNMLFFLWLLIGVLSRILPHLPSMTAITSLSLLSGSRFSKLQSTAFIILTLALSDTLLTYLLNYPLFGWWSLFNYSGFIAISLLGSKLQPKANFRLFGFLI